MAGSFVLVLGLSACGSADDPPAPAAEAAGTSSTPLEVSGTGVDGDPFGTGLDDAMAALTDHLGKPDRTRDPEHYQRIEGQDGWYEVPGDAISPSWQYPAVSISCWGTFCAIFGGDTDTSLALRGWELGETSRWNTSATPDETDRPDVRLEGTGITLGDTWERLKVAYPGVVAGGAEGGTLGVRNPPWPAVFDGAAEWRLSGRWDPAHPSRVPVDSVVTRLSGGEGPEPGCC